MAIPISPWRLEPGYGDIKAKIRREKEAFAYEHMLDTQKYLIDAVRSMPTSAIDEEHQKQVSKAARYAEAYGMSARQLRKMFHEDKPVDKRLLLL